MRLRRAVSEFYSSKNLDWKITLMPSAAYFFTTSLFLWRFSFWQSVDHQKCEFSHFKKIVLIRSLFFIFLAKTFSWLTHQGHQLEFYIRRRSYSVLFWSDLTATVRQKTKKWQDRLGWIVISFRERTAIKHNTRLETRSLSLSANLEDV